MKQLYSRSSLITVFSLLLGVIWLSPALAADPPTFTTQGQITAGLRVPGAMDLDGAGNLYVADARGGMVHKYSPFGSLLQSFDLQASGRGLAVAPDGSRLYVARDNSVVIVNPANGAELGSLTGGAALGMPGDIDLDAFGNVFVADVSNMLIKIYSASGSYRNSFGGVGKEAGQFLQIDSMSLNSVGQVVVADSSALNSKVHVFTVNLDLTVEPAVAYSCLDAAKFGSPSMFVPRGLTFDDNGRGFVLEYLSSQIRVFGADFGYLGSYTEAGIGSGQLNNVSDMIYDNKSNRLFVACDSGRIVILGVNGGESPVQVNTPPTRPGQQSPVAGSEVVSALPALVINNATDADGDAISYVVSVSQNGHSVFQTEVPAEAGATTTVLVDVELAENEVFVWSVQATDGQSFSAESVASFVVNAVEDAPSTPELSAPLQGEAISGEGTLTWAASTDPDPNDTNISYLVEVSLDEEFDTLVASGSLAATSLQLNSFATYDDLEVGAGYFWRVTASDDTNVASAPSASGQFVYETTVLNITANMPDSLISFSGNHAYAGQVVGFAPVELRDFVPGALSVVVERAGFEPFVTQVHLAEGDKVDLYAALTPAKAVKNLTVANKGINGASGLSVNAAAAPFVVDYDNDGDLDMLVGDGSGQVTLFANMQLAGPNRLEFANGVTLGLPVMPGAVPFVADWNNDRRKDLVIGQADGSVKVFINVGQEDAPAFASGVDVQTVNGALAVAGNAAPAVVDYNGDGAKDLLVGNAAGQVLVFLNQATDAAPLFAAPYTAVQVTGAVVPRSVDWDADGQDELLLTADGAITVYANVGGVYQMIEEYSDKKVAFSAAFAIDIDGSGKQLLAGQSDGQLVYLTGNGNQFVDSFGSALLAKHDELAELVAEEAPVLLADVSALGQLIEAGDYESAASSANGLALNLSPGAAQSSAIELAGLCQ